MDRRTLVALGALPPTPEDFARVIYPSMKALLGPRFAAIGATMPATFDENTPEVRAQFVEMVADAMARVTGGGE